MSPLLILLDAAHRGFPRVSGDEPTGLTDAPPTYRFSPREWG